MLINAVLVFLSLFLTTMTVVCIASPSYKQYQAHKKSLRKLAETRRARMQESMFVSKLLNKKEHELKESALLWGIADNSTDINTLDLLDETNYLKESLGEEFFHGFVDGIVDKAKEVHWHGRQIVPAVLSELTNVSVSRYVKRVVDTSKLITIKIIEIITFTLGGDRNDGEEGSIIC